MSTDKAVQALPVADAETKALYVAHFGNDEGWLGAPGSWFIEGVRAARAEIEAVLNASLSRP